jgi:hypothetical protein
MPLCGVHATEPGDLPWTINRRSTPVESGSRGSNPRRLPDEWKFEWLRSGTQRAAFSDAYYQFSAVMCSDCRTQSGEQAAKAVTESALPEDTILRGAEMIRREYPIEEIERSKQPSSLANEWVALANRLQLQQTAVVHESWTTRIEHMEGRKFNGEPIAGWDFPNAFKAHEERYASMRGSRGPGFGRVAAEVRRARRATLPVLLNAGRGLFIDREARMTAIDGIFGRAAVARVTRTPFRLRFRAVWDVDPHEVRWLPFLRAAAWHVDGAPESSRELLNGTYY